MINVAIVKGVASRNGELYQKIKDEDSDILTMWTTKVRQTLVYLGKPFLVWAKGELESP